MSEDLKKHRAYEATLYIEHISETYNSNGNIVDDDVREEVNDAICNIQHPTVYCIHDRCIVTSKDIKNYKKKHPDYKEEDLPKLNSYKKPHLHVAFFAKGPVSVSSAKDKFMRCILSGHEDKVELIYGTNKNFDFVGDTEYFYNYLIHDTDKARADHKVQYLPEERISVNGFDIKNYIGRTINMSEYERIDIYDDIVEIIHKEHFTEPSDIYQYLNDNDYDYKYKKVFQLNSYMIKNECMAEYHRFKDFVENNHVLSMHKK